MIAGWFFKDRYNLFWFVIHFNWWQRFFFENFVGKRKKEIHEKTFFNIWFWCSQSWLRIDSLFGIHSSLQAVFCQVKSLRRAHAKTLLWKCIIKKNLYISVVSVYSVPFLRWRAFQIVRWPRVMSGSWMGSKR